MSTILIGLGLGSAISLLAYLVWVIVSLVRKKPTPPKIPEYPALECCPACGGNWFYEGPHGGASVNVKCANPVCGKKFNWMGPFGFSEINNDDGFYKKKYPPCQIREL